MKAISGGGSSPRFSSRVGLAVFIFACILFTSQSAVAQTSPDVEQGIKPYGAYHGGDFDSVSLATGRLDLHIPFLAYPQRGGKLKLSYTIRYQNVGPTINELCLPMHPCTYYATDGGLGPQALLDQFITAGTVVPVIGGKQLPAYWVLSEPDGSVHDLVNTSGSIWESIDATGIRFDASSGSGVITNSSGTRYTYQWNPPEPELIEDANGNQMSINPTSNSTDTLGRTLPPYMINGPTTTDYSGCTGPLTVVSAQTWAMPSLQGGTETYKFCFANVSYNVSLTYEGITRSASGTFQQMQSIVLPNGTAWTFQYETTYGSLASITMPTGGSIAYTWVLSQPCGPGGFPVHFAVQVASRTVNANDGTGPHTWNYSWTNPVKITDPLENDSLHTITGLGGSCSLYETEAQYFQGSSTNGTLLKTVATDYLYAPNADISTPPLEMNVVPIHITTTWAANNKVSRIEKDYDSGFAFVRGTIHSTTSAIYGDVVAEREYDYGTGTWGSLLRQTLTSYLAFNNSPYLSYNLLKIPSSVQVNDGGGTQRAYTTYSYDGSGLSSSGITTQHDANPANGLTRGNQTSTSKWLNTTGGYLTSSSVYFDTGTVNTSTDPKSNVTTFAYSATYAGGYPTTVTNALHQSTTNVYDLNTGLLTSTTDPNGQIISSVYEPTTWRKTQVNFPDLGQANFCYSDVPTSSCYNAVSPFFVVVTQKLSSATLTETAYVDGLGRVTQTQLNSDPSGTIYTLTTYDADGRKSTVTNPYRSTSDATYGITTFQYDALGRPTLVIPPDGTTTTNNVPTQYCGGTSTMVIDQAGRWRRTTADALGRLLEVDEPNSPTASVNVCPGTSEPIWATTYTYDTLNDLASVSQGGSRNRSFVFDSLKRMTSSTNPETGTVNYTYDSDGNVLTKADARSITITYGYDALNRMTGRTYSNSDSAVTYTYDQAATGFFNIGRRTGMTDAGGSETWSYDSMGRELAEQRITDSITKTSSYTYNLDGSLATMTYPSGRKITYGYDAAARPISAIDTANSINYATSGTYAPPGGLSALTLGAAGSFTGISLSDTYNKRLQPNELKASSTAGTAMDLTYSFVDANSHDNGNAIQVTNNKDTTRTQQFSYDQVNRIATAETTSTHATSPTNCWGESYTYDQWANLTVIGVASSSYNGCSQESLSVAALANNQLSATGFSYDASGNLLGDGHNTYGWNAESEIKSAAGVNYTYDGNGNRIQKSNGKIYWYGVGTEILDESDASGNFTDEYVYFGGKRISHRVISGNSIYYYAEDFLGTSRVMTTSTGTVCYDADFYPFGGERIVTSTCAQNYKFEGKERDAETNNDDFGARYYSSQFGRWLSPDWSSVPTPIPYADLTNPQTLNLYQFVKNDPETFADVDGHLFCVGGIGNCPGSAGGDTSGTGGDGEDGLDVTNIAPTQSQWQTTIQQTGGTNGIADGSGQTGADRQAHNQPPSPAQRVLAQVKKEFPDLGIANGGVQDLGAHNGHENIVVNGTASKDQLAQIQKTLADNAGLFGPGSRINIQIGNGTCSLHVEFAQFNGSGDTGTVSFQSHIDRGNPNAGPVGLLKHVFVDGLVGAMFHHNDPGLDPQ